MSKDLHPELQTKLQEYRAKRNFNAEAWIDEKVSKFNAYMAANGLSGATVSVSGGVDSAVTLGLIKRALDAPNSPLKRVLGVAQPIHSSAWALERATEVAKTLGTELVIIDQTKFHSELSGVVDAAVGIKGGPYAQGQLRSYMRTPVGYYVAQLLSQSGTPAVVMGTGNRDEDGYLAYFCKAGDGVVDVQLIADLHKSEVFKVGAVLGVPQSILVAPPSADLWDGQTDEDELGFTYDFIELFTGSYLKLSDAEKESFRQSLSDAGRASFDRSATLCTAVHLKNAHKLSSPHNINNL